METMLLNSPPVPDHVAVDFTCDSRLLEASKDDEVQDRLIVEKQVGLSRVCFSFFKYASGHCK